MLTNQAIFNLVLLHLSNQKEAAVEKLVVSTERPEVLNAQ